MEVNDLWSGQYSASKNLGFKTSVIRLDLCNYSDVYTVLKRRISIAGTNNANKKSKS